MVHILNTQKDRKVEEILYQHNAENLEDSNSMFTYRKDEKALYKKLKIELVIVISIYLVGSFCLFQKIMFWLIIP